MNISRNLLLNGRKFNDSSHFNQPISSMTISVVTIVERLFHSAISLDQSNDHWDVYNTTNLSYMFSQAAAFNQPIGSWNVSNVTNMSGNLFHITILQRTLILAAAFNQLK